MAVDSLFKYNNKAKDEYTAGNFKDAAESYASAVEYSATAAMDKRPQLSYNLGNSHYRGGDYQKAYDSYLDMGDIDADGHFNRGNAMMGLQKYDKAVEAFKEALKLNPKDQDAKYNLSYALEKLKQQQNQDKDQNKDGQDQQDQQNKDQDQKKDDQKKDDKGQNDKQDQNKDGKGDQDKKDQQNQDQKGDKNKEGENGEQKDQQGKDGKNEQGKEGEKKEPAQKGGNPLQEKAEKNNLTKEEAARLLQALKNQEMKVQAKVRKTKGERKKVDKNW
ncbi:MAG: hypothetical protein Kapaf2KO_03240 [Candidatus Kapaibacteriales bacterium]